MGTSATAALYFLPFVIPICIWVAWSDLARMKIPNKAVIALFVIFVVVGFVAFPAMEVLWRLVHLVVVLAITFAMSVLRVLGAGDAKFAAAMAPFVALEDITFVLLIFAVSVVFGFITHRLARSVTVIRDLAPDWESWHRTKDFPMGYPLAMTLALYLGLVAAGY